MTDEKKRELIQELKIIAIASPVLIPLLEKRRKSSYEKLLSAFREGKTDLVSLTAELNAYESLLRDISNKHEDYNIMEAANAKRK